MNPSGSEQLLATFVHLLIAGITVVEYKKSTLCATQSVLH